MSYEIADSLEIIAKSLQDPDIKELRKLQIENLKLQNKSMKLQNKALDLHNKGSS